MSCVSRSARYVAFADVMKEIEFARQVWRFTWPGVAMRCMSVFEDHEGAMQLALIPITKSNSKHIDLRHHVFRELTGRRYIGNLRAVRFATFGFVDEASIQETFKFQRNYDMIVLCLCFGN